VPTTTAKTRKVTKTDPAPVTTAPQNGASQRDSFQAELALSEIDKIQNLTYLERRKLKKQIIKQFYEAREREIEQRLELFRATLLAKKDMELKKIAMDAQNAILGLEKDHTELMADLGIRAHTEISEMLLTLGQITTKNLDAVRKAEIDDDLKAEVVGGIKTSFTKIYKRIMEGVDAYVEDIKTTPSKK